MTLESVALRYLSYGWSVIPVHRREKRPIVRWQEFQQRQPTPAEVTAWFRSCPDENLGVVTGRVSGLVVLDVDPRHGGVESLALLEARHGPLPTTVEAVTGGGGRHLYFVHPGGGVHNQVALAPGIDLRGDGGMVVAPPSTHASGHSYRWVTGRDPGQTGLASLPNWLLTLAERTRGHEGHPLRYWRGLLREGVAEGQRNNTVASITGHLLWHGVDPTVALELMLCWNMVRCHPPLSEEEVARTVESITRLHGREEQECTRETNCDSPKPN